MKLPIVTAPNGAPYCILGIDHPARAHVKPENTDIKMMFQRMDDDRAQMTDQQEYEEQQ